MASTKQVISLTCEYDNTLEPYADEPIADEEWAYGCLRTVHSVVQLLSWLCGFIHSVFLSFHVFTGARSVNRLLSNSVIRLSVRSLGCSLTRASVCSFVCASGLYHCSVAPPFTQFSLRSRSAVAVLASLRCPLILV